MKTGQQIRLGVATGIMAVLFSLMGALALHEVMGLHESALWVEHSYQVTTQIEQTVSSVKDMETAGRGFVLTGDTAYLEPYDQAFAKIAGQVDQLDGLTKDNPEQHARIEPLRRAIGSKVTHVRDGITVRRTRGFDAAQAHVQSGEGRRRMNAVREIAAAMQAEEYRLLDERRRVAAERRRGSLIAFVSFSISGLVMLGVGFLLLRNDIRARVKAEKQALDANARLESWIQELEIREKELAALNELSSSLQLCVNSVEAYEVLTRFMTSLFPTDAGGVAQLNSSRNLLEVKAVWGDDRSSKVFAPDECYALRSGREHSMDENSTMICPHLHGMVDNHELRCIPMTALGETLGLMYFCSIPGNANAKQQAGLRALKMIAETFALALANLRLRETLRNQSIRDPLTGAFNRRYMETTLERELQRASRTKSHVGIMMLDLDHFKKLNDDHGHEAGDMLLKQFAKTMAGKVRGSDVVCRYGGEEFTIIMPEASAHDLRERAEAIRKAAQEIKIPVAGQSIGNVSVSIGLAIFPESGRTAEELLREADSSLYVAKAEGRNRVIGPKLAAAAKASD